jgi:hypothetical protein
VFGLLVKSISAFGVKGGCHLERGHLERNVQWL